MLFRSEKTGYRGVIPRPGRPGSVPVLSLTLPARDFILKILLPGELTLLSVLPRPSRYLRWARRFAMFIDIHELESHPLDFREDIRPDTIDLGNDVRQQAPLKTSGHAELVQGRQG